VPDELVAAVFEVMARTPRHICQVLTGALDVAGRTATTGEAHA